MQATDVLEFWFGASGSPEHGQVRDFWFTKSDANDVLVRERFGPMLESALRGELDGWGGTPHGALALIVVLDQFSRNIHRDTPRAFEGDAAALVLAAKLVDGGGDRALVPVERWFAYMPFEHSESLLHQYESVRLFEQLAQAGLEAPLSWARRHFDVVRRFGRFPHRNETLGRASTREELEFLKLPGSGF
jgi:uncharacterized protein (DUF924 family)